MINVTVRKFDPEAWNRMVIQANENCEQSQRKYICRVIYPDNGCTLELKTDQQIKQHFETHGRWQSNCVKMSLSEVINITRINSLNDPVKEEVGAAVARSLENMASKAEAKYHRGFWGTVRKIISFIFNFYTGNSVRLFNMPKTREEVIVISHANRNKLPFCIGNDATFARSVAKELSNSSQSAPSQLNKATSISCISQSIEKLKNQRLDLINDEFPKGVTQYYYPKRFERENIPQACSFFSATFVLYIKDHFTTVVKNFQERNAEYLITMRKEIIDRGLAIRGESLKAGMPDMATHPHDLKKHTQAFVSLKIDKASEVVTGEFGFGSLDTEFDTLFSVKNSESHPYCIIQADGQTFAFYHINQNQAFLFDSHKSWFAVVSRKEAEEYLTEEILHLEVNPDQGVDFYHGVL